MGKVAKNNNQQTAHNPHSFVCFETGSHYTAQAGPKLATFLPQSLEGCDYRPASPSPASSHL
jgi:hypothetical protein